MPNTDKHAVSREEFQEVRDAVVGLEKTVANVVDSVATMSTSVKELTTGISHLSTVQARNSGQQGTLPLSTLWHALGAAGTVCIVVAALIMYAIQADVAPMKASLGHLQEELAKHESEEGHPVMANRVTSLEQNVRANYLENETQHRWIADALAHELDWRNRTRGSDAKSAGYVPLQGLGQSVHSGD